MPDYRACFTGSDDRIAGLRSIRSRRTIRRRSRFADNIEERRDIELTPA
jgi:hypothetical protein